MKLIKEKFSKKLLIEGADNLYVIYNLCEKLNITESFDIINYIGISNLFEEFKIKKIFELKLDDTYKTIRSHCRCRF